MDENLKIIGERLYELRTEAGVSMDVVVKSLNENGGKISRGNLSRWERGENLPSLDALRRLRAYYNVTADYILGLSDERGVNNDNS